MSKIEAGLTPEDRAELKVRKVLKTNLPLFAKHALKIKTKGFTKHTNASGLSPLMFNSAQVYLHKRLEELKKENNGSVRAIILKGRQQGCSTYVAARFFQKVASTPGVGAYILTHEAVATQTLFDMAKRFYDNLPTRIKPEATISNLRTLAFGKMNSGYQVGTAKTKGTGRSLNPRFFHGSEVAHWDNAKDHASGILQGISDTGDTEVILESTANGSGNYYHTMWRDAVAGRSKYAAVFIPWFWQEEYEIRGKETLARYELTKDEEDYLKLYKLNKGKVLWRRFKITDMQGEDEFKQEYPSFPEEAFMYSTVESYISPLAVSRAMELEPYPHSKDFGIPVIMGYDPAQGGKDRDTFILRQGLNAFGLEYRDFGGSFNRRVAYCKRVLDEREPFVSKLYIDYGGSGWAVGSVLIDNGYGGRVSIVNFGAKADNPDRYANKRAEMWGRMKIWVNDEERPPSLPKNMELHGDITAPGYEISNGKELLESKRSIKKRLGISPDGGDSLALTFAESYGERKNTMSIFDREPRLARQGNKVETDYDIYSVL